MGSYDLITMLNFLIGETDAKGSDFLGCNWNGTDTVEGAKFRPPSVCGLPKERGSTPDGGNHTVRWYYDMEYGGCARYMMIGIISTDNFLMPNLTGLKHLLCWQRHFDI